MNLRRWLVRLRQWILERIRGEKHQQVTENPQAICPCGSTRPYIACHGSAGLPLEVFQAMEGRRMERQGWLVRGITMEFVRPIVFQGRRMWALGNRLYPDARPNQTFHEFMLGVLLAELGRDWIEQQRREAQPHYLVTCIDAYAALTSQHATEENREPDGRWAVVPDGPTQYLLALAFDICSLIHRRRLPATLMDRLRNARLFQGARYEIAVAAIFARLGYDIEWQEDRVPRGAVHCEFFATHPSSGLSIAVEAKSRHRAGILHEPGVPVDSNLLRGDVGRHIREAETQAPGDRPYFIFVDLNAPVTHNRSVIDATWRPQIMEDLRGRYEAHGTTTPFTAIYVTNFSYHYDIGRASGRNEALQVLSVAPTHPVADASVFADIERAVRHYGEVPDLDVENAE